MYSIELYLMIKMKLVELEKEVLNNKGEVYLCMTDSIIYNGDRK